jgi:hypothetical protein
VYEKFRQIVSVEKSDVNEISKIPNAINRKV